MDLSKVDRLEVLDQNGRMLVLDNLTLVEGVFWDDGSTFKIRVTTQEQTG